MITENLEQVEKTLTRHAEWQGVTRRGYFDRCKQNKAGIHAEGSL